MGSTVNADTIIPAPVSQQNDDGPPFRLRRDTQVVAEGAGARDVAEYLAELLRPATGWPLPVVEASEGRDIRLTIVDGDGALGSYTLVAAEGGVSIEATTGAGLFNGVQSLRQLLPAEIEFTESVDIDWAVAPVTITDTPRFAYRGAMLDVARHFFDVNSVKRYIDDVARLKINYLHLHLTDDQGWRLEIDGWPELTTIGASTSVDGDGGGFYTQSDYTQIVAYAASRFITIVPEIDVPGHTNAALVAYPELGGGGDFTPYEGVEVGFSSLDIRGEATYAFLDDVFRQVSALTPGPYLHIGGDESLATTDEDFLYFAKRATALAASHGKTIIGWHELGKSRELPAATVGQYWGFLRPEGDSADEAMSFVERGGSLILSPADVAYLDMKYDDDTEFGLQWAHGNTSLSDASSWEPTDVIPGVDNPQILGIEAPLWTETLTTIAEVEFMAFPRIAAIAEIAWSPRTDASERVGDLGPRLASFGRRLTLAGIAFHRSPEVEWDVAEH